MKDLYLQIASMFEPRAVLAVDFDGTLCERNWPGIGKPNKELIDWLIEMQYHGCKLILWTCREGGLLDEAVVWCRKQGLEFDAVNTNLPEYIKKYGGDSRKIFAHHYIDDKNLDLDFELPFEADRS